MKIVMPTQHPYTLPSHTSKRTNQNLAKSMADPTHQCEKHENITKPIRNAGFVVTRKLRALNKVHQNFNLVFKVNKLKTKYKVLAMWVTESSAFQKPHYA